MLKKIIIISFVFSVLFSGITAFAYSESYNSSDYGEENWIDRGDTYCSEKKGLLEKIKSAFVGMPTGYTPQIDPSPYLNQYYGPSYQQGYYTGNRWNDHNSYYPPYPMRVYGRSF